MIEYEKVMVVGVEVIVEVDSVKRYREGIGSGSRLSADVPDFFGLSKRDIVFNGL